MEELVADNPIILTVERQRGSAGYVSVEWMATGDHSNTDIHPLTGQVMGDFQNPVLSSSWQLSLFRIIETGQNSWSSGS